MFRLPDFEQDGWCLDDDEERHREAPTTFLIPDLALRKLLKPGDFAQLIFRIAVADEKEPVSVERMWVIVREPAPDGYVGMLNNEPFTIEKNELIWVGTELRFEYRHIITVRPGNEESVELALNPAPIPWSDHLPN